VSLPEHDERIRFEEFYKRKWHDGATLWEELYPEDQRVYAVALYRRRNEAIARSLPRGIGVVLDVGCGVGDVAAILSRRATRVVATDLSFVNVGLARQNLAATPAPANVAQTGAERLPFSDDTFDTVVLADVLEHIPNAAAALSEVRRVLRPEGVLACATPIRATIAWWRLADWALRTAAQPGRSRPLRFSNPSVYERFFSTRELDALLSAAGFADRRLERVCFYPAAETPGTLGALMRRMARQRDATSFRRATRRVIAVLDGLAWFRIGNQKQLWIARA
jgi:2-polyprenyl-3-methyl-5-hydroxy-6-metoxy-1,4-benzoquinol methylase